jgi:hypothetical protein
VGEESIAIEIYTDRVTEQRFCVLVQDLRFIYRSSVKLANATARREELRAITVN